MELSELDTRSLCPDINSFTALPVMQSPDIQHSVPPPAVIRISPKNPDLQRWRPANQILKICTARDSYPRVAWNCVITYIQSGQVVCITMTEYVPYYTVHNKPVNGENFSRDNSYIGKG